MKTAFFFCVCRRSGWDSGQGGYFHTTNLPAPVKLAYSASSEAARCGTPGGSAGGQKCSTRWRAAEGTCGHTHNEQNGYREFETSGVIFQMRKGEVGGEEKKERQKGKETKEKRKRK